MLMLLLLLLLLLDTCACFAPCQLDLHLRTGTSGYLRSPGYPGRYRPGTVCRWRMTTDPGSRLTVDCPEFDLPADGSVCVDRLVATSTGVPSQGETYCGRRAFVLWSQGERLDVYLVADNRTPSEGEDSKWRSIDWLCCRSWGGRFYCRVATGPADCDCGWTFRTRIVGGVETRVNEFPMMVGLVSSRLGRVGCGGTLVTPRHVLTAAHCLRASAPEETGILIGDHDTSTGADTQATRLIRVTRFLIHPDYDWKSYKNDLAIVEAAQSVAFNRQVGPACLPFREDNATRLTAVGWGTLEFGGEAPERLRKVSLDVIDPSSCLEVYGPEKIEPGQQICTYSRGKDACQFDSGGPLLHASASGRLHLLGVISHGIGCAERNTPSVNTRVRPYLGWILENTRGESYCVM
uniref:Venom S1 protease with CUB domain 8 n=1 Tax=Lethocerus distinctifemur TaxID=280095 RepID=A0A2K8JL86_9HEMI|nr:venom S1 protease with CUB domain 8 [Lethocerus distinctifemur]